MAHNDLLTSNIVLNSIQAILLGSQGLNVHGTGCGPLWFVYTLIILKAITLLVRNRKFLYILSALGLMGAVLLNHYGFEKDWAITNTLLALPCFAFGLFLSSYKDKVVGFMETYRGLNFGCQSLLILTFFIITYAISEFNGSVRMFQCNYGNSPFLFLLGTLSGSIAVGLSSMSLDKVRLRSISIISNGNIIILAFHLLVLGYICAAIMKVVPNTSWAFDLISLLASIFVVLCFIPVIILLGKSIPIALGRKI